MMSFPCDAVIFDLDGVLVDSQSVIERYWRRWAAAHGIEAEAVLRVAHGRRTVETIRLVAPHLDAEAETAQIVERGSAGTDGLAAMVGAHRLLQTLPAGAWAVATSGTRRTAATRLAHTGLPFPDVLVTAEDVARGKPDPEVYLLAAERLGAAPARCVVVEDAPPGLEAARAAGMRVIAVATTHAAEALTEADVVAPRLADLQVEIAGEAHEARLVLSVRP